MLLLVRDLVAIANSGGGVLSIGSNEPEQWGIDRSAAQTLDGTIITNQVNRYISPATASVVHEVSSVHDDRVIVRLRIKAAGKYPYVFSKDGQFSDGDVAGEAFQKGDIYVRHGDASVRADHSHIAGFIDRAVEASRGALVGQIGQIVAQISRLPEDSDPLIIARTPDGSIAGTPEAVVDLAVHRHRGGERGSVLDADTLLTCFLNREDFVMTDDRLSMLVRSALRRPPSLYFWLDEAPNDDFVREILTSSLTDEDRDKSDAKTTILEIASLIASDEVLEQILDTMRKSDYKHFRNAAEKWPGREAMRRTLFSSVTGATISGTPATSLTTKALYQEAERLAHEILRKKRPTAQSKLMSSIGRLIYLRSRQEHDESLAGLPLVTPVLFPNLDA